MFSLKTFRNQPPGLPNLLNFERLAADGIVKTKSGAYLAGWYYRGRDLSSSTDEERNYITARVNAALCRLGDGWYSWFDAVRIRSTAYSAPEDSHFPDPVTRLIDEERRAQFMAAGNFFESEYALVLMYEPPESERMRFDRFIYDDDLAATGAGDPERALIDQLLQIASDMEDFLGDVLRMRRMRGYTVTLPNGRTAHRDDLVNYLHYCVTGLVQPINIPDCPMYLEALIGGQELFPGDTPRIGEKFVGCVAIDGLPSESTPNCLDALDNLALPYRWSTRFIYMEQQTAISALGKIRRKWLQKIRSFFAQVFRQANAPVNEDAVQMTQLASAAITDASSGLVAFGYLTTVVVLYAETRQELDEWSRCVVREVRRIGFGARRETINTMQAWHGAIPGHTEANVRRPLIHTLNLADLLPLASVWPGLNRCPCPFFPANSPPLLHAGTNGATPFRLNLHVDDLGHTLIIGPPGAGKSTLLCMIAAQFRRYPNATIIAFDMGRSMLPLVTACGGDHFDLGASDSNLTLCPLQDLSSAADIAWACEWIATLYQLQTSSPVTPRQRDEIHRAVIRLRGSDEGRSLTDFRMTVQDEDIRAAISHYTIDGAMGHLLDGKTDGLREASFTVFEITELMEMGDVNALPVLLYLFRRINKMMHGQPVLIPLDEAWIMLGHPVFRAKLREWLKVMRKANGTVIVSTQQLSDATRSGIFDVIVESCPTKILLPNEEATKSGTPEHPGPLELYRSMGLNDAEMQILITMQRKRHYYYTSPEGRRVFDLALGPLALAIVSVSDKEQVGRVKQLHALHGDAWPFVWWEEKGVDYDRYIQKAA